MHALHPERGGLHREPRGKTDYASYVLVKVLSQDVSRPSCRVPSSHGARLVNAVIVGDVARNHYFASEFGLSRLPSSAIWLDVVSRSY